MKFIFDLDGVIVHSTPLHVKAWEAYLEPLGIDSASIGRIMLGRHNDDIVRELFGDTLTPTEICRHGAAKEAIYREMIRPGVNEHMVPGVRPFLERYAGVDKAVASNAERANVDCILRESGLDRFFRVVLDGNQVSRPKPDPEIYVRAAGMLDISPEECVIFEDSKAGIEAARSAGASVVGLRTTCTDLTGVDLAIDDFFAPELEEWLREQEST